MINYKYPKTFPRSEEIKVYINSEQIDVLKTNVAYFASVAHLEPIDVEITGFRPIGNITISPQRLGITAQLGGCTARFRLETNVLLHISLDGISLPLFFYGNPEQSYDGRATYYFAGGQIYEVGEIVLKDHESVYIEGGAVVKGSIRATGVSDIRIYGEGVLDGSFFSDTRDYRTILLYQCGDAVIRDIIMIEPPSWMIMLADCHNVHIDRVKQIGEVKSSDGIDIVGSHEIVIENCILRNNDDCVVIKGFNWCSHVTGETYQAAHDVYNVRVRACTLVNAQVGHAIEIGHELMIKEVRNITFTDIDIVSVHGHGAPFAIHVGDRALVKDVTFENIRVEHFYDKLIDFRIMRSRYNIDEERGRVEDILLKDIYVTVSEFNPGYSVSIIGGYDEEHQIKRVTFENFYLGDKKLTNGNQLDLFLKEASEITFK
ncbi:MAG: hypothetical protein H7X86_08200 [Gorillibacterium sp.]|nr:hypothetical protein [Gorillibacterium sp.]